MVNVTLERLTDCCYLMLVEGLPYSFLFESGEDEQED